MNYKHLRYFFTVAREGSIVKAAEALHVSPQTISGQLSVFEASLGVPLFDRFGKKLLLNDAGKIAMSYAEDIFALGDELKRSIQTKSFYQQLVCTVGVVDVIPKILAKQILETCFTLKKPIRLVAREGDFELLLSDLAMGKIDMIFSDRPLTPEFPIKAHSHEVGTSGLSFYTHHACKEDLSTDFPQRLNEHPFLIAGESSAQKINLQSWFDQEHIRPLIVGEFDDTALLKFFGQAGYGVFCTTSIIEQHVIDHYNVRAIGRTETIKERLYAITPERKMSHPGVNVLLDAARALFTEQ